MSRRKEVSNTKFVVERLTSSYSTFKLSERDFLENHVIGISQSTHKSLLLFEFDNTA